MNPQESVENFIRLIRGSAPCMMRHAFTEGGCYRFYLILKNRFPNAEAYNDMQYHVITKIAGKYWDISGMVPSDRMTRRFTKKDHEVFSTCHFDEVHFMCKMAQLKVSKWDIDEKEN